MVDKPLRKRRVGEESCSLEAPDEAQRRHVQVGPLAVPLSQDVVDVVAMLSSHASMVAAVIDSFWKDTLRRVVVLSSIPASMWAIRQHAPGGHAELVHEQVETPRPGPGEVLVRVFAAAITRDELDWPVDRLPAIPSYEFSGVVASVAPDVGSLAVGDAVFALGNFERDGAAAEYVVLESELLAPKPQTLDHVESASVPLAGLSAWQALFVHGKLAEGERVLVHGAAGGVGSFAVQLARRHGAHVVGTASPQGLATVRALGADEVVDNATTRFEEAVDSVDLVFDTAGGELLARSPAILREGGRLVSVAEEPPGDGVYFVVEPKREQLVRLGRLVDRGELRPLVDSVFPLADAHAAFERSMATGKRGKVVLRIVDE